LGFVRYSSYMLWSSFVLPAEAISQKAKLKCKEMREAIQLPEPGKQAAGKHRKTFRA
jgi:hypothetical protein